MRNRTPSPTSPDSNGTRRERGQHGFSNLLAGGGNLPWGPGTGWGEGPTYNG
ncbi:MAG: hypothetical protein AAGA85_20855 [Bacteroidota bacterium]